MTEMCLRVIIKVGSLECFFKPGLNFARPLWRTIDTTVRNLIVHGGNLPGNLKYCLRTKDHLHDVGAP